MRYKEFVTELVNVRANPDGSISRDSDRISFPTVNQRGASTDMRYSDFGDLSSGTLLRAGPPYPPEQMDAVRNLQRRLEELGYPVGSTGIDGKYGPRTARAVSAFKRDNRLQDADRGRSMSTADLEKLQTAERVETPTPTGNEGGGRRGSLPPLAQDSVTQGKVGEVLDFIAQPESAGRYDAVYPGRRRPQILDMTIDELIQDMRSRGQASGSSASGRYQYIRTTLQDVVGRMGLDTRTTKFDPETQDRIAIYHLRADHGLDNWLAGRMSNEEFLNRLARTWAGLPSIERGGLSYHHGTLDNRAGMGVRAALGNLDRIQGMA